MISDNKILAHLDRIVNTQQPITADIFLSAVCNNNCPYCTYKRHNEEEYKDNLYMDFLSFKKYVTKLIEYGIKGIILTGGGEPTVNPDFLKITNWLEENNIPYGINTNFNIYYEFNPNYLKVSLDGYDEESYKKIRGVNTYNKVIENIKKYSKYKTEKTNLGIQLLVNNKEDIIKFYNAHKDLKINYFNFRPNEDKNFIYKEEELKEILKTLNDLKEKDNRVTINYKWNYLNNSFSKCYAHWSQFALNQKGEVLYCCHKPNEIIGHIMDKDIFEKHKNAKYNPNTCDIPCRLTGPNQTLLDIQNFKEDIVFI